jgi:hypothetical protein
VQGFGGTRFGLVFNPILFAPELTLLLEALRIHFSRSGRRYPWQRSAREDSSGNPVRHDALKFCGEFPRQRKRSRSLVADLRGKRDLR